MNFSRIIIIIFSIQIVIAIAALTYFYLNKNTITVTQDPNIDTPNITPDPIQERSTLCLKLNAYKVSAFKEGIAIATIEGKDYFINTQGQKVITEGFDFAHMFDAEGKALVTINNSMFFIDKQGNRLANGKSFIQGEPVTYKEHGLVRDKQGWFVINLTSGKQVSEYYRDFFGFGTDGYILATKTDYSNVLLNYDGSTSQLNSKYKFYREFVNGYAIVDPLSNDNSLQYLMDTQEKLSAKGFNKILFFSEGLGISIGDKREAILINTSGDIVGETYLEILPFVNGYAIAKTLPPEPHYTIINKEGLPINRDWNFTEIKNIQPNETFTMGKMNNKWYIVDLTKAVLLEKTFTNGNSFESNIALVKVETDDYFFVDTSGNKFCDPRSKVSL